MGDVVEQYAAFLERVLPADYGERAHEYEEDVELRRSFHRASYEDGWLMPDWEPELGGRELPAAEALAVRIERARRRLPRNPNIQGVGVVAPPLRRFGTAEQRERLLVPLMRGDDWWAIGMSEPDAGSDIGGLRMRAVEDGDSFVLDGQKIWTTQADESRWAMVYVRTDPSAPKHKGLSCFAVDLGSPGVTVIPIRMASAGEESFCEVFFEGVRVPNENLVGPLNGGWQVMMESLASERDLIWIDNWLDIQHVLRYLGSEEPSGFDLVRVGRSLADAEAIRFTGLRVVSERALDLPSPAGHVMKLLASEALQEATRVVLDSSELEGMSGPAFTEFMKALPATLYGGTSEIHRDLIAERALRLPRDR
jgi:alkylation response protein AidB-like acyl-CoA dehydrogenase